MRARDLKLRSQETEVEMGECGGGRGVGEAPRRRALESLPRSSPKRARAGELAKELAEEARAAEPGKESSRTR